VSTEDRVRTDPRISRRRKAVEKSRRRRLMGWLIAIVVLAGAIWGAFFSPLLEVEEIRVLGANHASETEIREAAGLPDDQNLLLVSTRAVTDNVAQLPWVAKARVDRKLPDTVRIRVTERNPAIVLSLDTGRWTLDARSLVLERGAADDDLAVLSGVVLTEPETGERIENDGVTGALRVWRSLPPKLKKDVAALFAPSAERISVSLSDRTLIRYGAATELRAKRRVLVVLLRRLKNQRRAAAYIDLRVPTSPAVAPAAPSAPGATPSPSA
jgi:cell division protein FtsQ